VIRFLSCGFQSIHDTFRSGKYWVEPLKGNWADERTVRNRLQAMGFQMKCLEIVSCLEMKDPEKFKAGAVNHYGTNKVNLMRAVRHPSFAQIARRVLLFAQNVEVRHPDDLANVVLYCRSGNHRSVSVAELLAYCFSEVGCHVYLKHKSELMWVRQKCRICDGCNGADCLFYYCFICLFIIL